MHFPTLDTVPLFRIVIACYREFNLLDVANADTFLDTFIPFTRWWLDVFLAFVSRCLLHNRHWRRQRQRQRYRRRHRRLLRRLSRSRRSRSLSPSVKYIAFVLSDAEFMLPWNIFKISSFFRLICTISLSFKFWKIVARTKTKYTANLLT